ncbi:MAG TPA: DNA-3-methyladenine glycosylase [Candidatus Kapabacteria bacterium]|nr:DNA-3-methyladenine glycosylase [Candidatus Kapabacteria bacterium]
MNYKFKKKFDIESKVDLKKQSHTAKKSLEIPVETIPVQTIPVQRSPVSARRFSRAFYLQHSPIVAREILGAYLHRVIGGEELIGKIVETEAYGVGDAACHAFRGKTPRNAIMFDEGGFSYIYFTYGMHFCFNISTNVAGIAEAVLIRAVEPVAGIERMRAMRPKARADRELTSGPGRLCQAFGLTREQNAIDLINSSELFITRGQPVAANLIGVSTRIGINVAQDFPWRFFIKENEYVSRAKPSVPGKIIVRRRT